MVPNFATTHWLHSSPKSRRLCHPSKKSCTQSRTLEPRVLLVASTSGTIQPVVIRPGNYLWQSPCVLCKTAGRSDNTHNLAVCQSDNRSIGRSRPVAGDDRDADEAIMFDEYNAPEQVSDDCNLSARSVECPLPSRRVNVIQSLVLNALLPAASCCTYKIALGP